MGRNKIRLIVGLLTGHCQVRKYLRTIAINNGELRCGKFNLKEKLAACVFWGKRYSKYIVKQYFLLRKLIIAIVCHFPITAETATRSKINSL